MNLYIASIAAQDTSNLQVHIASVTVLAEHILRAEDLAESTCYNQYPPKDGWTYHLWTASPIDSDLLEEYLEQRV